MGMGMVRPIQSLNEKAVDYDVLRQRLHMLGIPASFSYRLTHWERFYCYWSAGIVCEVNLSGKIYSAYKSQRDGNIQTAFN